MVEKVEKVEKVEVVESRSCDIRNTRVHPS